MDKGKAFSMQASPLSIDLLIFPALAHQANLWKRIFFQQIQADKRLRPLARLALKMARPARVSMRARKPCLRLRFRLLGWKVRLLIIATYFFYVHVLT